MNPYTITLPATAKPTVRPWHDATLEEATEFARIYDGGWPASDSEFYGLCMLLNIAASWDFDVTTNAATKEAVLNLLSPSRPLGLDEIEGTADQLRNAWDWLRGADFDLFGLLPSKQATWYEATPETMDTFDLGCQRYHADKDDRACS